MLDQLSASGVGGLPIGHADGARFVAFASIDYSPHARDQMRERRIGVSQVERTLRDPDQLRLERNRLIAERDAAAGNFIRVVYIEKLTDRGSVALVITAIRITL